MNRRALMLSLLSFPCEYTFAKNGIQNSGLTQEQKMLLQSIPVFNWLSVGLTTRQELGKAMDSFRQIYGAQLFMDMSVSPLTSGQMINLGAVTKTGLLNETGMKVLTVDLDSRNQKVDRVCAYFDKGWRDVNIQAVVNKYIGIYSKYSRPVFISDAESEASDEIIIFEIGKFVVEISLPQSGTLFNLTVTTKYNLRKMRSIDGTLHLIEKHLR